MATQTVIGTSLLVAACLMGATVEPARGLECYKSSWSNPESLTLNKTSTVTCSKPSFRFKRDDATTAAAPTVEVTTLSSPKGDVSVATNDSGTSTNSVGASSSTVNTVSPETGDDYYCFVATVKNETQKLGVERGCKSGKKEDECVTLDKSSKLKVEKCTTCNKDKCNESGASAAALSLHCVLLSTAIVVRMLFKNEG